MSEFGSTNCPSPSKRKKLDDPSVKRSRAPGRGKGPLTPPKPPLLVNNATYAVEQVMSIIKEEDIYDCDEYAPVAIGESRLHDLVKVVNLRKHVKGNNEVIKELQGSVTLLTEQVALLEGKVKELDKQFSSQVDLFIAVEEEKIRLSKELEKLRGELSNAETSAIAKYSSQEYLHDLGILYVRG
ncbi:hypothetical protein SO802_017691 [Lithocarpus litseifolius]|uniref:Uncharacterized protein n=1 Tax=Lithocarpus litseifolius TaxID=425828 RepID=A0AAW2CKR9_9ROSI